MIYENLKAVTGLVGRIVALEDLLKDLNRSDVVVLLSKDRVLHNSFSTIGTWESCEHPFKPQAQKFKLDMIEEAEFRIRQLKRELEKL